MIWATVSSQSCFCWLYRASPSLAAKNIISVILALTIWWCSCVDHVLLGESLLWPVHSLGKTLLVFPCFIFYSKAKLACYSRYLLTSYICIPFPYDEKDTLFCVLVLGLVGLHRTLQLQLLQCSWLEHRLGLLWYWMAWFGNEQRSCCPFWDCIQVLHFGLFCWLWWSISKTSYFPVVDI